MIRVLKLLLVVAVLGLAGLTGYAYLGDLSPGRSPVEVPVTLVPG
jgi:hypothetical protein